MALFHNPNPSKFVVCTKTHYFSTIFLGFAVFFLKVPEGPKAPLDVHQVPLEPLFLPTLQCHPNRLFLYLFVQSPQTHLLGRILDSLSTLDKLRYPMPFAPPTFFVLGFGLSLPFISTRQPLLQPVSCLYTSPLTLFICPQLLSKKVRTRQLH